MTTLSNTRILKSEGSNAGKCLRVLLAEDSASDLFWLEMVFKSSRLPYSIEVVSSAQAVKQHLEQSADAQRPDLIFLDLDVPISTALEILQDLSDSERVPSFVLASAAENSTSGGEVVSQRYIEKPFTHQKLFDCLSAADLNSWTTQPAAR